MDFIGKRILIRDACGEWWDCLLKDIVEQDGKWKYQLQLDNGDTLFLPIDDECGILLSKKSKKPKLKLVKQSAKILPFKA